MKLMKHISSSRSSHFVWSKALGATVAVLALAPFAFERAATTAVQAATPAKTAPSAKAATPVLLPRQQKRATDVMFFLRRYLTRRLSSPTGKMTLIINPARADLGYFNDVFIAGKPLMIKKLRISDFSLHARNVHLSTVAILRPKQRDIVTYAAQTTARAVISEDDLTWMFAQGKSSKDMNLRAKFIGNQIRVTGNWDWGWFSGPVIVQGTVRLIKGRGGNQVWCDITSLKLNGAEVPAFLKSKFSAQLNPLISYDDLPFKPNIRKLTIQGGKAIITT